MTGKCGESKPQVAEVLLQMAHKGGHPQPEVLSVPIPQLWSLEGPGTPSSLFTEVGTSRAMKRTYGQRAETLVPSQGGGVRSEA